MRIKVIDKKTRREVDYDDVVRMDWCPFKDGLFAGFALHEDGGLILMDNRRNHVFVPEGIFEVSIID